MEMNLTIGNSMIQKDSGLFIALTRLANLYCDDLGTILQDVDVYGKGFHMIMGSGGIRFVEWENTTSFLANLEVR